MVDKKAAPGRDPYEWIPLNFKAPRWLVDALEKWVVEMNAKPRGTPIGRADLIRGVLAWAVKAKPDWE
jgi:hypothetical protein